MGDLTDNELDRLLAAGELPAPPPELHARVMEQLRAGAPPTDDARQQWRERLAEVRRRFEATLGQMPQLVPAMAFRGAGDEAILTNTEDAVLAHVVRQGSVRGQVFLTELESPANLTVRLSGASNAVGEEAVTDASGRFCFLDLPAGEYELAVPELGLTQTVRVAT